MNILYIGSAGALSSVPFHVLCEMDMTPVAVGVHQPVEFKKKIIALESDSLALVANQRDIPVVDLSAPIEQILEQCEVMEVDTILMSCYSKRLPQRMIEFVGGDCFNMHPSLLPGFRGPEPVFWQMKLAAETGVSWHRVTAEFDAGDFVAQSSVLFDEGDSYDEICQTLANKGAELMLSMISQIEEGSVQGTPQSEQLASYYPYPSAEDFELDTRWTAEHAFNFMSATQKFAEVYRCETDGYCFYLKQALDYDNNRYLEACEIKGDRVYIPFKEGVLTAIYTDKMHG